MLDGITISILGRSVTVLNNWIEPRLAVAYFAWMVLAFMGLMRGRCCGGARCWLFS